MWDNEGNGKLNLADFELPILALEADWIREACLLCLQKIAIKSVVITNITKNLSNDS